MMSASQKDSEREQDHEACDYPGKQGPRLAGRLVPWAQEVRCLSAGRHQRDSTSAGPRRTSLRKMPLLLTRRLTSINFLLKLETSKPKIALYSQEKNPVVSLKRL